MTITDLTPDPEGIDPAKVRMLLFVALAAGVIAALLNMRASRQAAAAHQALKETAEQARWMRDHLAEDRAQLLAALGATRSPEPKPGGTRGEGFEGPAADGGPSRN